MALSRMGPEVISDLSREIDQVNTALGWREGEPEFTESMWLLASELYEAGDAWRSHGMGAWTVRTFRDKYCAACGDLSRPDSQPCASHPDKPEGIASELADAAVRLLDSVQVHGIRLEPEFGEFRPGQELLDRPLKALWSMSRLVYRAESSRAGWTGGSRELSALWRQLEGYCAAWGIDLEAEMRRKIAFNRTRGWHHGGKRILVICKPCRDGVHLGTAMDRVSQQACRGGTWCDCRHLPREKGADDARPGLPVHSAGDGDSRVGVPGGS